MIVGSNILAGASGQAGYFLQRSVRLRASASAYFNRTFSTPTNNKIWTFSAWVKRGLLSSSSGYVLLSNYTSSIFRQSIQFYQDGIEISAYDTSAWVFVLNTTQVFRDPSAWYHVVVQTDTTQAVASNRIKLYINGAQVTAFNGTPSYPSLNYNTPINTNTATYIGAQLASGGHLDGYLTEINFIDGQALTPTSFGEYNTITGVWQPKKYGGTYGTNGFYLNFNDNSAATAAAIGKDSSGNGNNWTPNNISVTAGVTYDSMTDVPTLTSPTTSNFCVGNPLNSDGSTWTNANLNFSLPNSTNNAQGTMAATSGKFYWEVVYTSGAQGTGVQEIGLRTRWTNGIIYSPDGSKYINGTNSAYGATYTTGDVIGVALDMTGGTVTFYKNNVSQGAISISGSGMVNATFSLSAGGGVTSVGYVNFGQRPFTYTPPTGFKALNTYNLPTPTIPNGANQFAATLYTGNSSTQTITNSVNGVSMQPDFVWTKGRSQIRNNVLYDSVRGANKQLYSNSTSAELTVVASLTSFNSNGFSLGGDSESNWSSSTYVGWQWKASNATGVTNTAGSITSTVSANPTAGFSIVTWTGTGAAATIGHGLGVAPSMVIWKYRSAVSNWAVGHNRLNNGSSAWSYWVQLETTAAQAASSGPFNNTAPTSTVFSVGSFNNANNMVAYCFSEIAGYSKFGSYTGNGSTDGTFVYTGFRPRWVMVKSTGVNGWVILDTSRSTYNLALAQLIPNLSNAEDTTNDYFRCDILSNGFKLRTTGTPSNANGVSFIYAAFAESPFNYSLAR